MLKISVEIEGITSLLMNRFTEENECKVSSGISSVTLGERDIPRIQAKKKAYMDEEENLYIPGANIFACIIEAGKFHKLRNKQITTQKSSLIPAGVALTDVICSLNTKNFEVDTRSVVIPKTRGRIVVHRPRLDEWTLKFHLIVDDSMFDEKIIRMIIDDAGKKIGLGDYRPDRKGPFGKFVVKNWKLVKEKEEEY